MMRVWKCPLLEADLHAVYGWDAHGPDRHTRTGPWLRRRVEALPYHPQSMVAAKIRAEIEQVRAARAEAEPKAHQLRAG